MHFLKTLALLLLLTLPLSADEPWSEFRGPRGDGSSTAKNLPIKWSEKQNIVWKTAIHDRGWSSPVILGNQIWLTTATRNGHQLYAICVDRTSGKVIHDLHLFDVKKPQRIASDNSYATPTPVIESGRVYVHYGTYGIACLDTKTGRKIWSRRDLNCDHEAGAGPGSSPMMAGNLLVVNVDGRDVQYVIAMNKTTGKTVWKTPRSVDYSKVRVNRRKAYSMPILIPPKNPRQLVSNGAQGIFSYDPKTGRELWRVQHHGFSHAARPVFLGGLVFTTVDHDHPELWAIRADGKGDVTGSHIAWKEKKAMPQRSSPLLVGDQILLISRRGIATALDAKSGKETWKKRLRGAYSASPIKTKSHVYLFNEDATCTVLKTKPKIEVVSVNPLSKDILVATPAVAGEALFVRTERFLYRIERKP